MNIRPVYPKVARWLLTAGVLVLGGVAVTFADDDRIGRDAPHQERNLPQNVRKSALPLAEVTDPTVPVRKAKAVKKTTTKLSSAGKKKAEQAAKERTREGIVVAPEAAAAKDPTPRVSGADFNRVGNNAPHQERSSNPNAHGARLLIWERD